MMRLTLLATTLMFAGATTVACGGVVGPDVRDLSGRWIGQQAGITIDLTLREENNGSIVATGIISMNGTSDPVQGVGTRNATDVSMRLTPGPVDLYGTYDGMRWSGTLNGMGVQNQAFTLNRKT